MTRKNDEPFRNFEEAQAWMTEFVREYERYKAALERIAEICDQPVDATVEALRIARRALNPLPPTDRTTTDNTSEQ